MRLVATNYCNFKFRHCWPDCPDLILVFACICRVMRTGTYSNCHFNLSDRCYWLLTRRVLKHLSLNTCILSAPLTVLRRSHNPFGSSFFPNPKFTTCSALPLKGTPHIYIPSALICVLTSSTIALPASLVCKSWNQERPSFEPSATAGFALARFDARFQKRSSSLCGDDCSVCA